MEEEEYDNSNSELSQDSYEPYVMEDVVIKSLDKNKKKQA